MDLELVPIEGREEVSQEEKNKKKKRSARIKPELLEQFSSSDEVEIKIFLAKMIILIDEFHHEMEEEEFSEGQRERLAIINEKRFVLFEDQSESLSRFIKLLALAPIESSEEIDIFVKEMRRAELQGHFKTTMESGISAATDNPFLMQLDDDIADKHKDLEMQTRATPGEIEALVRRFSLEEIIDYLITARKMTTGEFWTDDYYDL